MPDVFTVFLNKDDDDDDDSPVGVIRSEWEAGRRLYVGEGRGSSLPFSFSGNVLIFKEQVLVRNS